MCFFFFSKVIKKGRKRKRINQNISLQTMFAYPKQLKAQRSIIIRMVGCLYTNLIGFRCFFFCLFYSRIPLCCLLFNSVFLRYLKERYLSTVISSFHFHFNFEFNVFFYIIHFKFCIHLQCIHLLFALNWPNIKRNEWKIYF